VRSSPPNRRYISWFKEFTAALALPPSLISEERAPKVVLAFTGGGPDSQSSPDQNTLWSVSFLFSLALLGFFLPIRDLGPARALRSIVRTPLHTA
jgi:hypothetical protein